MKRAIITPTYSGHFCFIKKYLESFNKYLEDRDFPICFIISKKELKEFNKIIKPFKTLNINIFFLEDILKKYNINETPDELMTMYGRLSFQTIKKIYGALYIGADQFLILDSESTLVKPTNINSLFDQYFKDPKFFISRINNRRKTYNANFTYEFIRAITSLMGKKPEFYTTESYEWFYELRILKDSIKTLGAPIDVIRNYNMPDRYPSIEGILEALWYYQYLLYNNNYGYKIYVTDDELKKYLKENYRNFHNEFNSHPVWITGVLESYSIFVNKQNKQGFINLFNDFNITISRLEWPAIRKNVKYQKEIIENTNIHILASSQSNAINCEGFKYLKNSKYYNHLKKNIEIFASPFNYILKWGCSFFNIIFYGIKLFIRR